METYISTGHLPAEDRVRGIVSEAHQTFSANTHGALSDVYPALTRVDASLFGISVVGADGTTFSVGDAGHEFTIMSVAKPFVFALMCDEHGSEAMREQIGVNATGLPFNSLAAMERTADGRTNPMVNPGAIATTGRAPGATAHARWEFVRRGLSRFAGRELALDEQMYASATATNQHNRAIVAVLEDLGRIGPDPAEALDAYTRQSCLRVTVADLATMGATLADGGLNPKTGEQVVDPESCRAALAVMTTAGLYETSGDWLYTIGLPGKSGIGGGIVTVSPGKGGLGTFAPLLDTAGNSIKGQLATRFLSRRLGLDLFASAPLKRAT
ncbi:glutaminase 2 [Rhizocola hellebori]|uniref:Glutaminase n=1 Tax=Rhizocola hellebori TaxID=1392758 RepID=A0A8J3QB17_9ACTN|nr:glutaminase A [Rhizocola hellebori]GIH06472.1 glutaminase 2 [Rhizocola hellebori]